MSELNIIIANNDQLAEIYTALKQVSIMLKSYNQMCVKARDDYFHKGNDDLAKEVEQSMEHADKRMESIGIILQSIEE